MDPSKKDVLSKQLSPDDRNTVPACSNERTGMEMPPPSPQASVEQDIRVLLSRAPENTRVNVGPSQLGRMTPSAGSTATAMQNEDPVRHGTHVKMSPAGVNEKSKKIQDQGLAMFGKLARAQSHIAQEPARRRLYKDYDITILKNCRELLNNTEEVEARYVKCLADYTDMLGTYPLVVDRAEVTQKVIVGLTKTFNELTSIVEGHVHTHVDLRIRFVKDLGQLEAASMGQQTRKDDAKHGDMGAMHEEAGGDGKEDEGEKAGTSAVKLEDPELASDSLV